MDVEVLGERPDQGGILGVMGENPQLDLRVIRRQERPAGNPATNAWRIWPPSSVRIGMFCRLGSLELSRPVAATTWLNEA